MCGCVNFRLSHDVGGCLRACCCPDEDRLHHVRWRHLRGVRCLDAVRLYPMVLPHAVHEHVVRGARRHHLLCLHRYVCWRTRCSHGPSCQRTCLTMGPVAVYDTQLIIGGRHKKYKISEDEYIFAALNLCVCLSAQCAPPAASVPHVCGTRCGRFDDSPAGSWTCSTCTSCRGLPMGECDGCSPAAAAAARSCAGFCFFWPCWVVAAVVELAIPSLPPWRNKLSSSSSVHWRVCMCVCACIVTRRVIQFIEPRGCQR